MSTPAAIYCRSSKDRAEIQLPPQREELRRFAQANDLRIVEEFADTEISGSLDETGRPGLRNMLAALRAPDRKWAVLLTLDTSRIARDVVLGNLIQLECEKHGVELRYSKIAVDGKDAFGELLLHQLRAFDRLHSRLSTDEGLEGLLTNIAKGHRAGGRAPIGYKLERTATGGMRGGMPVFKSKLVPDPRTRHKMRHFCRLAPLV